MKTTLFIFLQYLIPQHLLSRFAGFIAEARAPWFKNRLIPWFIKRYDVDMSIALEPDPSRYNTFNDFFTRALRDGERPIDDDKLSIVSPADGCISQLGAIEKGRIFQAKGQEYSLLELVGGKPDIAAPFQNGLFSTVYLSPKDYHRVHMPLAGTLRTMIHVPGDLFSVNDTTAANVPRLFARNERVVCVFDTEFGPMAVILVGAMIVASIETTWAGLVTPVKKQVRQWDYLSDKASDSNDFDDSTTLSFEKGDEIGRFKLGSTAIVLMGKEWVEATENITSKDKAEYKTEWATELSAQSPVKMGEPMGHIRPKTPSV